MIRKFLPAALLLTLLLAACGDNQKLDQSTPIADPVSVPTRSVPTSIPVPIQLPHAAELRFALIGQPQDVNVWALFDEQGANYDNYAVMSDYWPRLYTLAPPALIFTPRAANGFPTPVTSQGDFYTSTVTLRDDLKWTDGSPFTAEDVAFTVNAGLNFKLGFDWNSYYSPAYLSRAEAVDATRVKFYFKQLPNVGVWQYGALQGPIVQQAYWQPKIKNAATLMPSEALRQSIDQTRAYIAELEPHVDSLEHQIATSTNKRDLYDQLKTNQTSLDDAKRLLEDEIKEYTAKLEDAHQALYALDHGEEPTLGVWTLAGRTQDEWFNVANPDFPFEMPSFDRVVYQSFDSEEEALKAFQKGRVNAILEPGGLQTSSQQAATNQHVSLNGDTRFLVFNPAKPELADRAFRQALACMIWSPARKQSAPLAGFVLTGNDFWLNTGAITPCADLTEANPRLQIDRAIQFLKAAGYSWVAEPTVESPGQGLILPNGQPFNPVVLLSPSREIDSLQAHEAELIEKEANYLGIPLSVQYVNPYNMHYAIFSAQNYDMAILGWRLSLYPGYLCDWFGEHGQFDYNEADLKSVCDTLKVESDLQFARSHVFKIQSILVDELPFIPLYADFDSGIYSSIYYPFQNVLGGFNGLYGAPTFAIPAN